MVVPSIYMSQFSPRVVENFLSDKQTMKSFGIFVSGFIYSVICMLFIREDILNKPILAGTIGVIYIVVGLFNFIMFINSVGKHIQASNLIDRLYNHAKTDIQSYKETISTFESIATEKKNSSTSAVSIKNRQSGYIQQINFEQMFDVAKKHNIDIRFNKVMGQFVTKHMSLGEFAVVSGQQDTEKVLDEICQTLLIGERRTEKQDFSFSIQKIVEVALKSLSPGINDPNTGIFCIHNLGMLLSQLSTLKEGYVVISEEATKGRVYRESYNMDKILKDSFFQIIHYGEADVYVMTAVMKACRQILFEANVENEKVIQKHAKYLFNRLINSSYDEVEQDLIIEVYKDILQFKKQRSAPLNE